MKIEVKQACEIEGRVFTPDLKKKPKVFDVPAYFIFVEYFVILLKNSLLKIVDVSEDEFKDETLPEKYHECEPDPVVISVIEGILMAKESKKEGEDETTSDPVVPSDSISDSQSGSEEPKSSEASDHVESEQKLPESEGANSEVQDVVKAEEVKEGLDLQREADEKEFASLHEKAKRLNNKEKKRYEELKAKLKG